MNRETQLVPLDTLVELRPEKSIGSKDAARPYLGLEHIEQGFPRLLGWLPSSASVSTNSQFEKDDILFGKLRPNLRKSIRAPFRGYCSTDILVLRARDGIDPEFAAQVFQWDVVFNAASATAAGTKMPRTSWKDLRRFCVFLPRTSTEQRSIASVLNALNAAIEKTAAVIAKLKQVHAGLLHDLLSRGVDDNGELRDPISNPDQFKDSPLGVIPRNWDVVPVALIGEVRLGRQRSPAHEHGRHLRPYLRVANVFDAFIDYSNVLRMNFEPIEQTIYGLNPGDILLNEGQSLDLVGRSAVFDGPPNTFCFQNTLVRFRCYPGAIPGFYQAIFKFWLDSRRFTRIARQTTSVAHLGADRFANMPCVRPSVEEQERIAAGLRRHRKVEEAEEKCLAKLQALRSGLTTDLLTGHVRVPQTIETGAQ